MSFPLAFFLQNWHELDFYLGGPDDFDKFPYSAPVAIVLGLLLAFFLHKARKNYMALPELPVVSDERPANVTVIIPARNEEHNIAGCIRSFPHARVIVVDDHSEDRTARIASENNAEVISAPVLKDGAMGKPNACFAGSQLAATTYIFFADADTRYRDEFLHSAVGYADENQSVLVSGFLKQETVTLAEKMLLPYAFALYFTGVSARRVHDEKVPEYLANGQCMLFLRAAYEFIGGHMVVKDSVIEDVAMAMKLKRHRMKLNLVRAEHLGSVRMYDSLSAIWRGFKKNSFRFLRVNHRTGVQVVFSSILLTSVVPVAVWLAWEEQWGFLAALLLLPPLMLKPWYGGFLRALLAYPAIYLFQLIALDGMISNLLGLRTSWKGRSV
ncbi:MAG: glycosyltransferase [Bryobacterales bacterium]|nr:glycosyltransferase [Bryobacterales bacterium]